MDDLVARSFQSFRHPQVLFKAAGDQDIDVLQCFSGVPDFVQLLQAISGKNNDRKARFFSRQA